MIQVKKNYNKYFLCLKNRIGTHELKVGYNEQGHKGASLPEILNFPSNISNGDQMLF